MHCELIILNDEDENSKVSGDRWQERQNQLLFTLTVFLPPVTDHLFHPHRQIPEQRQLKALALPCFERQHDPQEQHGQRNQNSK